MQRSKFFLLKSPPIPVDFMLIETDLLSLTTNVEDKFMDESRWDTLVQSLERNLDLHRDLLEIVRAKQDAIQDRDTDRIESLTEREEALSSQLKELTTKQTSQIQGIADQIGLDTEQPTIADIRDEAGKSVADTLSGLRTEIKQVVRDVQTVTKENMFLLENRIRVYDRFFETIQGDSDNDTYDNNMKKDSKQANPALVINESI